MLYWACTIHNYQGNTLEIAIIDFGKSTKCSGVKLVAQYCVHTLSHFPLCPKFLERLQNINLTNSLLIIRDAYVEINLYFDSTEERCSGLWL